MIQGCKVYEKDISSRSYVDVRTDLKVVDRGLWVPGLAGLVLR